ncbi:MAG: enoyl-CoA hydratase-related protein [Acidobacteriota bacterium]
MRAHLTQTRFHLNLRPMYERESDKPVACVRAGSTAIVTLNGKGNALTVATLAALRATLLELGEDRDIRVVILTGSGTETFSIGADLDELAQMDSDEARAFARSGIEVANIIEKFGKATIAAVNGFAIGVGSEIALACHLRIAVSGATLTASELPLGLTPVLGFSRRLGRLVGKARALEMALTGNGLSAIEAERLGVFNRLVTPETLIPEAVSLAEEIGRGAPVAMQKVLEAVGRGFDLPMEDALMLEEGLFTGCFETDDMREGVRAFLEKRSPEFKGQ